MLAEVALGSGKLVLDGGMGGTAPLEAGAVAAESSMAISSSARVFDGPATIAPLVISFGRRLHWGLRTCDCLGDEDMRGDKLFQYGHGLSLYFAAAMCD